MNTNIFKRGIRIFRITLILNIIFVSSVNAQYNSAWPTPESLKSHNLPEWLLDAKILIQYVGAPKEMTHREYSAYNVREQRRRKIELTSDLTISPDSLVEMYKNTGAKVMVSMVMGAFPGTEGFIMTDDELSAFRKGGFKIGIHYNLLRREMPVQAGDPTYINVWQNECKAEVERTSADFVFFDGSLKPLKTHRTDEFVAWYYNWERLKNKEVWVNDDWGNETTEFKANPAGDIIDMEVETFDTIPPKPWINWDILTNGWNCWVNEYGMHKRSPVKREWKYRDAEEQLISMLDVISKGGIWCVQMINTKEAWNIMFFIGKWLEINGEAIYGTRPLWPADLNASIVPAHNTFSYDEKNYVNVWWLKWQKILEEAKKTDWYFTRKANENLVFAIYTGELKPELDFFIPHNISVKSIELLGNPSKVKYAQNNTKITLTVPKEVEQQTAYTFKLIH